TAVASRVLAELPAKEVSRLRDRATRILDTVGPMGFAVYIVRAANAFGRVRQDLPNHATSDLSEWFRLYESKKALLEPGPGSEHDCLQDFLVARSWETLPDDAPIPALVDYAVQAPAGPLEAIHGL